MKNVSRLKANLTTKERTLARLESTNYSFEDDKLERARDAVKRARNTFNEYSQQGVLPLFDDHKESER